VTIQLPIYDERYVVERLLDAAAAVDYPRERLEIQVLDDSSDETTAIAARKIAEIRGRGIDAVHVRRCDRSGFKAGALQHGLERAGESSSRSSTPILFRPLPSCATSFRTSEIRRSAWCRPGGSI